LYAEIDGSGPAVCLVHAGVANLRMWDPQVTALAEKHTVIRYDTRGFGRTESDPVEFSNREDLIAVLDHAEAAQAVLVGASRGGIIALDTTLEFPARVAGFVSVAGGISGYDPDIVTPEMEMWDEIERRWKAKEWEWLADFETAYWYDGPGQPTDRIDPALRTLGHGWILDNYRAEKPEPVARPLQPPAAERLGELKVPVLVMVGLRDDAGTTAAGRHLAATTGAPLLEFDTAHMVNLEEPERFLAALQEFLAAR
jgi:pimeloyl-ACP methyl ester carboxylesterase